MRARSSALTSALTIVSGVRTTSSVVSIGVTSLAFLVARMGATVGSLLLRERLGTFFPSREVVMDLRVRVSGPTRQSLAALVCGDRRRAQFSRVIGDSLSAARE